MKNDDLQQIILEKQDQISQEITEIKVILGRQEVSLNEHIRRTDLAEKAIELNKLNFSEQLEPIQKHVALVDSFFKICGGAAVLIGIIVGILKIFAFFS